MEPIKTEHVNVSSRSLLAPDSFVENPMSSSASESLITRIVLGWIFPLLIVGLGAVLFMAMGESKPKQVATESNEPAARMARLPAVIVKPVLPFEGIKTLDIDVTGTVVPFRQVTLAAEIGGRVVYKSDACRIGKFVEEGELLFKLDATDFQLEVERLAAMRDSEYAQQKELEQEISNAQRSIELAEQDVALQEKELKRLEKLPNGFASATELDQARRLQLAASTQRQTIQNQLNTLEARRTRIQLGERLATTQLSQAKINLARTEIKAPIAGVIVAEMVEQASYIQKGATLCMIHDTQRAEVSCNLRADQLMLVLDQQNGSSSKQPEPSSTSDSYELPPTSVTVEYRVAGRDESLLQWQGTLSRYEGIGLNAQSRTIPIRITVENPRRMTRNGLPVGDNGGGAPPALVQGMFVDCKIHTTPKRPLVLIPKLALRPGNQVWKFVSGPSLIERIDVSQPQGEPNSTLSQQASEQRNEGKSESTERKSLDPKDWTAGRVKIVSNQRAMRSIRWPIEEGAEASEEYWVVEATDDVPPGSLLVVSPMANMIGDGTDKARVRSSTTIEPSDDDSVAKDER
jgi:multidrug efflux pump subunit AcrA (membrane-fusion protein)